MKHLLYYNTADKTWALTLWYGNYKGYNLTYFWESQWGETYVYSKYILKDSKRSSAY